MVLGTKSEQQLPEVFHSVVSASGNDTSIPGTQKQQQEEMDIKLSSEGYSGYYTFAST